MITFHCKGGPKQRALDGGPERDSREARHRMGSSKNISSLDLLLLCAAFCGGTIRHSQSETHSLLSQEALCLRTGTTVHPRACFVAHRDSKVAESIPKSLNALHTTMLQKGSRVPQQRDNYLIKLSVIFFKTCKATHTKIERGILK